METFRIEGQNWRFIGGEVRRHRLDYEFAADFRGSGLQPHFHGAIGDCFRQLVQSIVEFCYIKPW